MFASPISSSSSGSHKRKDISLRLLDQIVETPASIRRYLDENPAVEVNEIFNVTPHSVEGMEWTSNMLQRACSKHLADSVAWLLENGADPNSFRDNVEDINSIPPITLCILHAISPKSRAAAIANIRKLVAHGAHLNHDTDCSSFPLECAASIITPRSPRDTWELSMCLVELGAHTRHLAPNMFSAPPETLVRELRRLEKERQMSMKGSLAFALQCNGVPRRDARHCPAATTTTTTPTCTGAPSDSAHSTHSESLSVSVTRAPDTPVLVSHSPFKPTSHGIGQGPFSQMNQGPFSQVGQGPFSQMGLVPSTPPPSHTSSTSSSGVLPLRSCTPTPPRQHVLSAHDYVYCTPKGPKNISRKRSFAQIPWAPVLKHKAKRRRMQKVPAPAPAPAHPPSPKNSTTKSLESEFATQIRSEFATPTRSVIHSQFATPTRSRSHSRATSTSSHHTHTHTPSSTNVTQAQAYRRRRISSSSSSSSSSLGARVVSLSADVQRVILDFALPIPHAPRRRARIDAIMAMKSKRDRGHALPSWFSTKTGGVQNI